MFKKKSIIVLAFLLLTTGCWDYRELNEMAIVGAVGLDYDEKKKLFEVSIQVLNAKKTASSASSSSSPQQSPITVFETKAKTIHEALRSVVAESPKKLYIGHLEVLVVGEDFAKKHLKDGIDFFLRDPESRKEFHIIVAKGEKASDVIKILTPLEGIPAHSIIENIYTAATHRGIINDPTFDEFLSQIYGEGVEAVLPAIKIEGKPEKGTTDKNVTTTDPKTTLKIDNLAIFKGFKLIGYLDQDESIGYNIIENNLKSNIVSFPCDDEDNYAAIEITSSKSNMAVEVKGDKTKTKINVSTTAVLSEFNCKENLSDEKVIEKVRKEASKKIKSLVNKVVKVTQEKYKSDILGVGEKLYTNNFKYWQKHRKEWSKILKDTKFEIKVDLKLPKKGTVINAAKEG